MQGTLAVSPATLEGVLLQDVDVSHAPPPREDVTVVATGMKL